MANPRSVADERRRTAITRLSVLLPLLRRAEAAGPKNVCPAARASLTTSSLESCPLERIVMRARS